LGDLTDVFAQARINIERGTIVTLREQVRNRFRVQVTDLEQLEEAMDRLRKVPGVNTVTRRQSGA
jgi:(p)ppGpp synthase/HD superfamily hydrolase